MKKVFKYITLVVLLFLGLIACGLLLIFFVPNLTIFNVTAINYNKTIKNEVEYKKENVQAVLLDSKHFDIEVVAEDRDDFACFAYANTFGYAIKQNSEFELKESLTDGLLKFEIDEPFGAAFTNNSNIKLFVPENYAVTYQFINETSDIVINKDVEMNSLYYKTKTGNLKIQKDASLSGNLVAEIGNGELNILKDSKISNLDVSISIGIGKFVTAENIDEFSLLGSDNGIINLVNCTKFTCIKDLKACVTINEVSDYLELKSNDVDLSLAKVNDIVVDLTGKGSIGITEVNGTADIKTNSGEIRIVNGNSVLNLASNSGLIYVQNAYNQVYAQNNSGNVAIICATGTAVKNGYVNVKMKDGRLTVDNAKNITADLKGSAYAICKFVEIKGTNSITTENGSVTLNVPYNNVYNLTTKTNGSVRVNLLQVPEYGGYTTNEETTTYVNHNSTNPCSNILNVTSTEGSITIIDSKLQESFSMPSID